MKTPYWRTRLPRWLILALGWLGDLIMLAALLALFLLVVQRIVG
ncbi:hypothetical protein [Crenobacter caeni]|nr:hypothetical protein [Crenobacter caeni]